MDPELSGCAAEVGLDCFRMEGKPFRDFGVAAAQSGVGEHVEFTRRQ
jgi:hypothetical protein